VYAKVLYNHLNTPVMRKWLRNAKTSTNPEDIKLLERLRYLKQLIEEALAA
jgi:hypothetical protein